MSNSLAIADVTSALVNLLQNHLTDYDSDLSGINVTSLPLDKALDNYTGTGGPDALNVFLYHVVASSSWRNQTMPSQVRRGETAPPPLGLNLHYLVSAWGGVNDDVWAHRILGAAMAYLHDNPMFNRSDLQMTWLAKSDLSQQVERVRITEEPLTVDEMYKLWSAFQTNYRISAAYQVSVVLIESTVPAKAPLPALTVNIPGPTAPLAVVTGVQPTVDLVPLAPSITSLSPQSPRPFSLYGETLTINGYHLTDNPLGSTVTAELSHPILSSPTPLATSVPVGSPQSLEVTLSVASPPYLPAGNYTLAIEVDYALVPSSPPNAPSKPRVVTNELPFTLAPQITTYPASPVTLASGSATVAVIVSPVVLPNQRVFLVVGDQLFPPNAAITSPVSSLSFDVTIAAGTYYLRVRVDGADSPVIDMTTTPPTFVAAAQITFLSP